MKALYLDPGGNCQYQLSVNLESGLLDLGDCFEAVANKLTGSQSRLSQSMYALKEFAIHVLDLDAPIMETGFGHVTSTRSFQAVSHPGIILAQVSFIIYIFFTFHKYFGRF